MQMQVAGRVLMALQFWPRGGSAQVVRYLVPELAAAFWPVRLLAGSRGAAGAPGHAGTFFAGLDVQAVDYTAAFAAFERGEDPLDQPVPLHPSYEDRPDAPDRVLASLDDRLYERQVDTWATALRRAEVESADVVHLHHLTPVNAALALVRPGAPLISSLHGTEMLLLETIARGAPPGWSHAAAWRERMVGWARRADRLVVVSPRDRERAAALFELDPGRIAVVPHGVDTERFAPARLDPADRLALLRRWLVEDPRGWDETSREGGVRYSDADLAPLVDPAEPVLLFVGRFTEPKRLPLLLRAYGRARREHGLRAPLLVWGGYPGEWEGEHPVTVAVRERIEGVFFLGWRGHDELPLGLACADVFVSPSVGEAFGQVFLEAMACGLPVIAAADGGPLSFVDATSPRRNGWLVEPDDEASLVAALVEAAGPGGAAERRRRGDNGLELTRGSFSWAAAAKRVTALYGEVSRGVPTVG